MVIGIVCCAAVGFRNAIPIQSRLPDEPTPWRLTELRRSIMSNEQIRESSGLAKSLRIDDAFWTHNDSGDSARLFLIHRDGRMLTEVSLDLDKPIDFEDMTSVLWKETPYLIVGDIGGNAAKRNDLRIHILLEPDLASQDRESPNRWPVVSTLIVSVPGGATNYESLAFDTEKGSLLLLEKAFWGGHLFEIPFVPEAGTHQVTAKEIAYAPVPMATACDLSPDGRMMIICTYPCMFLYERNKLPNGDWEDWESRFKRPVNMARLENLKQAEAVCFGFQPNTLFVTSENLPAPLVEFAFQPPDPPTKKQ